MNLRTVLLAAAGCTALALPASSQSNAQTGLDVSLSNLGSLSFRGRTGTWPGGENGLSMSTTSCNVGMVDVNWLAPMNEDHPMISFLVVAERNGRLEQISDYSYVKHGFLSTNSPGCGSCPGGPGSKLVVGCSDTYGSSTNANNFYLGPPQEIDPWLADWDSICSHFDRGEPAVAPPNDCDGVRSLTNGMANALGPVGHRVRVLDSEFENPDNVALAFQAYYVVAREAESVRDNNIGWRTFTATWNAGQNRYNLSTTTSTADEPVINAWSGAVVADEAFGGFDGRVFVGGLPTNPGAGTTWHYEYAIQNRDSFGGVDELRIPLTPGTMISAAGFKDLDGNALNDWTSSVVGNELVFSGPGNPVAWNTIYNVWFDATAAPSIGDVTVAHAMGLGDLDVGALPIPTGALTIVSTSYCTAGTSAAGCVAALTTTGTPSATAPSGFFFDAQSVEGQKDGLFFWGANGRQANPWGSSTSYQCVTPPVSRGGLLIGAGTLGACDGSFNQDITARWTAKPATNPGAGAVVQGQLWYRDPFNTSNQTTSLSDAVEFTVQP